MVKLDKRVKLYVRFKRFEDGIWHTRAYWGEKNNKDISRILGEAFKLDIPLNSPIRVEQPNWAGTGETVLLVDYRPFETIWTNKDHIRKETRNG